MLTQGKIRSFSQDPTSPLRCGNVSARKPLCISNATLEAGLQESSPTLFVSSVTIRRKSCSVARRNSASKRNVNIKKRLRDACTLRKTRTSRCSTTSLKPGDSMRPRKSRQALNLMKRKRSSLYSSYSIRRLRSCSRSTD